MGDCCDDEFNLLNFLLHYQPEKDFYSTHCRCLHPFTLVGVRFFFTVYCIFFIIFDLGIYASHHKSAEWFKYFTTWAYICCTLYFAFSFFLAFMEVCQIFRRTLQQRPQQGIRRSRREDAYELKMKVPVEGRFQQRDNEDIIEEKTIAEKQEREEIERNNARLDARNRHMINYNEPLPFQFKIQWMLMNIAITTSTAITIAYWAVLHDYSVPLEATLKTYLVIDRHGIVFSFVFFEFIISRMPFRILHFIYPLSLGLIYLAFHLIQWNISSDNIYSILDWNNRPGHTLTYFAGFLVSLIVIHAILFFIHKLKLFCK